MPYVSRYTPGIERILQDRVHCYFYHDVKHAVELVHKLLSRNDKERLAFGNAAAEFVREHHPIVRRMYTLIQILENVLGSIVSGSPMPPRVDDFFLDKLRMNPA